MTAPLARKRFDRAYYWPDMGLVYVHTVEDGNDVAWDPALHEPDTDSAAWALGRALGERALAEMDGVVHNAGGSHWRETMVCQPTHTSPGPVPPSSALPGRLRGIPPGRDS